MEIWPNEVCDTDIQEGRENLENAKEAIEESEREYRRDMEDVARQEHEEGTF